MRNQRNKFLVVKTWAEIALPWTTYLARSCYLLQQGRFVADVLYFYGEDSNLTAIFANHFPDVPEGYNYDYVNADALIHKFSVTRGLLTTPSGMSYRVLALDPRSNLMSLPVLKQIDQLVEAGAIVVGDKPERTPSLADDRDQFHALADKLWGSGSGGNVGQGHVYGGQNLKSALSTLGLVPDLEYVKPQPNTSVLFVHRKLANGDLYFVDNRNDRSESFDATFRVTGKVAELWHPDTGLTEPVSYRSSNGRTTVPLQLEPWGTVFVVFRRPSSAPSRTVPAIAEEPVATIEGSWEVAFQPDRGAPPKIMLDKLISWTDSSDEGVKYFSGAATYTKTVDAPASWFKSGSRLWIDLGDVKNLAGVSVNARQLGIVWKAPYRMDVIAREPLPEGPKADAGFLVEEWLMDRSVDDKAIEAHHHFLVGGRLQCRRRPHPCAGRSRHGFGSDQILPVDVRHRRRLANVRVVAIEFVIDSRLLRPHGRHGNIVAALGLHAVADEGASGLMRLAVVAHAALVKNLRDLVVVIFGD